MQILVTNNKCKHYQTVEYFSTLYNSNTWQNKIFLRQFECTQGINTLYHITSLLPIAKYHKLSKPMFVFKSIVKQQKFCIPFIM